MKKLTVLSLLLSVIFLSQSFADTGATLICATDDNEIRMTADLTDLKNQKIAVASIEGIKSHFAESLGKKRLHTFEYQPEKPQVLVVKKNGKTLPLITLSRAQDAKLDTKIYKSEDPTYLETSKFQAILSMPSLDVNNEKVICHESHWKSE